jgi:hypothetical protein
MASWPMVKKAIVLLIIASLFFACGDRKEAHLERFLQPGQQPEAPRPPALNPMDLDDAAMADQINQLGFCDFLSLLGSFRYQATVRFEFRGAESFVSLAEDDEIVAARNGDLSIKSANDSGQGFHGIYSGGKFWLQNRYGVFHPRDTLNNEHLQLAAQAFGSWPAIYRLYRGRLSFAKQGLVKTGGREAVKYSISLSGRVPRLPGTPPQPQAPAGAKYVYEAEPTPAEADRWRDKAVARSARGSLLLDMATGAVLGVTFTGELEVPGRESRPLALNIEAQLTVGDFNRFAALDPPPADKITPLPERIQVDTHPLDFYFGKGFTSTLGAPAGVAAKPQGESEN